MVLGYWHAKRRIQKGLAPLAYHRVRLFSSSLPPTQIHLPAIHTTNTSPPQWLVPRAQLARVDPRYAYAAYPPNNPAMYGTYRP